MRVLFVEDDARIAESAVAYLRKTGFAVDLAASGEAALTLAAMNDYDVAVLDIRLPGIDGLEVCRRLRSAGSPVRILMATARDTVEDRIAGLDLGADDYVVKPFGFRELVARIRAVSRRAAAPEGGNGDADPVLRSGPVEVDTRTRRVTVDGTEVVLTRKEFDLLALLARDPGATRTRDEILEEVWDAHWYGPTKTLDVHVASLRKKLGDPTLIETVRGVGFRLGSGS